MKKIKPSVFIDALLYGFICFFLAIAILYFFKIPPVWRIVLACVTAVFCCFIILKIKLKQNNVKFLNLSKQKSFNNMLAALELLPENKAIKLFLPIFDGNNICYTVNKNCVKTQNTNYYFDFNGIIERKTAVLFIRESQPKKVVLFCGKASDDCALLEKDTADMFTLIQGENLYDLIMEYHLDLPKREQQKQKKTNLFVGIAAKTTKKRASGLAFLGAYLILFSKLTFYPLYYIIFGIILLISAISLLIFGKKHTLPNKKPIKIPND